MRPLRIVSLLPAATEILCLLGLQRQLVGISHECNFPASVVHLPKVTSSRVDSSATSSAIDAAVRVAATAASSLYTLDEELLESLAPDVIITQAQCEVCAVSLEDVSRIVECMPGLSATRIVTLAPSGLDDVFADIETLANCLEVDADVKRDVLEGLRNRVQRVQVAVAGASRRRAVLIEWLDPLMAGGHWTPEILHVAGGSCSLVEAGRPSPYVAWDRVRDEDPEVILIAPCGFTLQRTLDEAELLRRLDGWADVEAVRNGRVYAVDGDAYFNRSGPRLVDSLEIAAHLIQPDHWGPVHEAGWRGFA